MGFASVMRAGLHGADRVRRISGRTSFRRKKPRPRMVFVAVALLFLLLVGAVALAIATTSNPTDESAWSDPVAVTDSSVFRSSPQMVSDQGRRLHYS